MSESKTKSPAKSEITSPSIGEAENLKTFGGQPPTKKVEAIEKVNSPSGRKRAPEAVGF
jgi:hypothetical protein